MRVGIIGCGGISKFHFAGYEAAGCEIIWCCDIKTENAKKWAKKYNAKITTNYMDVLNDPNVDIISITTLTNSHKEILSAAIGAGKPAICEKTLGMNAKEALEIARLAQKSNSWLATAYMKRYFPAVKQAKKIIEDTNAKIISVYAKTYQPWPGLFLGPFDGLKGTEEFLNKFLGGGVLVCGGSHILNLLHYFCGIAISCAGDMSFAPGTNFDRCTNALLWFKSGAVAHFEASWHEYRKIGYERNGWDETFEINTDRGQIKISTPLWNEPEKNAARLSYIDAISGDYTEYRYDAVNPFNLQIIDVTEKLKADQPPLINAWDGYAADVMIDAIKTACNTHSVINIDWAPDFLDKINN